ncbi:hypothetical protein ACLBYD_18515 [Rhodococcus sp. C26F]
MGSRTDAEQHDTRNPSSTVNTIGLAAVSAVVVLAALPGVAAAAIFSILAYELRRVRVRIWATWAAATAVLGIAAAGFSPITWLYWSTSFATRTWLSTVAESFPADSSGLRGWMRTHSDASILEVVGTQLGFGIPVGFTVTIVVIVAFRARPRALRGRIEGPEHSNMRPVGFLDRRRRAIERQKIADGYYTGA